MNPLVDRLSSRTAALKYDLPSIPMAWMLASWRRFGLDAAEGTGQRLILSVLPGRRSETVHSNETRG